MFKPRSIQLAQRKNESLVLPVTVHQIKGEITSVNDHNAIEEPGNPLNLVIASDFFPFFVVVGPY